MSKRREVPRYVCHLSAQVLQPRLSVTVTTLSINGCCIAGAGLLDEGQKYELTAEWGGRNLRAHAEVVWKNQQGKAGCRFLSISHDGIELIKEILTGLPLEPLQRLSAKPD